MMMKKLERDISVLVCKMEKVFPPGWFNAMKYLQVYLPWKAKVGGSVQFKWMCSQERELKRLRSIVWNRARVEECITEAFTCKDITTSQACISHVPTM
jgi:hypothetical protein